MFLIFRNCPKKVSKGEAVYIVNALQVFLKRLKQKRPIQNSKLKKTKKKQQQKLDFFFNFSKLPLKGAHGDADYILRALKVFLKRMKQKRPQKVHPQNAGRGTLILNSIDCGRLSFQVSRFLNS